MNNVVHNTAWVPAHFHTTVAGPVFLGFTGMTLHLVSTLTGKPVRLKSLNVAVPWIWLLERSIGSMARQTRFDGPTSTAPTTCR